MLPEQFVERMRAMLGEEATCFLKSLNEERYQALRFNPCKADTQEFLAKTDFKLHPVPWEENGFYYEKEDMPGKHPYHEAGVYYIQEPSAMAPVTLLDVHPGHKILDLCAAPGGKSTQIAARLEGKGILVSNEIHPARAKILSENVERMGIVNCLVTNETPERLAEDFSGYFDRILVDAPCSGEGMFRKNEEAAGEWSLQNVRMCAARQDEILDHAAGMLRAGGRLVYSTCTFAAEEDEGTIARFLMRHPDFSVVKPWDDEKDTPFSHGRSDWAVDISGHPIDELDEWSDLPGQRRKYIYESVSDTIRLWPHKLKGEGHFAAALKKTGGLFQNDPDTTDALRTSDALGTKDVSGVLDVPGAEDGCLARSGLEKGIPKKDCGDFIPFEQENLCRPIEQIFSDTFYFRFGEQLYLCPKQMPSIKGLKVLRPGLHLGTLKKNRFEPSHALALALCPELAKHSYQMMADTQEVRDYLSGLTFQTEGEKGWYLITVDGYSLGWGKLAGGIMKNHYPKGLRK